MRVAILMWGWLVSVAIASSESYQPVSLKLFDDMAVLKKGDIALENAIALDDGYLIRAVGLERSGFREFQLYVPKSLQSVTVGPTFSADGTQRLMPPQSRDGKRRYEQYMQRELTKLRQQADLTIGNGPREYFLFSDPDCPYCAHLDKQLHQIKDATIYLFLTSLHIPGHDKRAVSYVISYPLSERSAALSRYFNADVSLKEFVVDEALQQKTDVVLSGSGAIMQRFQIKGTPTLLDARLKPVNPGTLMRAINSANTAVTP